MTARFLHIGCRFPLGPKTTKIDEQLNAIGDDWIRYNQNCWIVWTERPSSEYFNQLRQWIAMDDSILIFESSFNERVGFMPPWVWAWIDAKRQQSQRTLADILSQYARLPPPTPTSFGNKMADFLAPPKKLPPQSNPFSDFFSTPPKKKP